ncbi:hypothetical protein [Streptomyces olivochromogenes]|uniref:Uncharacterized protein n=1 Tax=Streptomyces olivochromogenes TaxID=1963 RepID=A0A250V7P3_STROL|nr:hypothetical protein [Streptomyces olivochromogenes]KUN45658.1 hypothetical protein AQJ27_19275 [Streptomyces olivochromogenes]GAX50191.1 hypothetical protein SO3561_01688 [Streptomyces olivochromogenes]
MTVNKALKKATRKRMAAAGEPYNIARQSVLAQHRADVANATIRNAAAAGQRGARTMDSDHEAFRWAAKSFGEAAAKSAGISSINKAIADAMGLKTLGHTAALTTKLSSLSRPASESVAFRALGEAAAKSAGISSINKAIADAMGLKTLGHTAALTTKLSSLSRPVGLHAKAPRRP